MENGWIELILRINAKGKNIDNMLYYFIAYIVAKDGVHI